MKISRMMLGTVQFGLDYGIANSSGKPSYESAREIIKAACDSGINTLDTAAAYGTSEDVIGRALEELQLKNKMLVITKVLPVNGLSGKDAEDFIFTSIRNSIKKLGCESLDGCLFHREEDFKYMEFLLKAREKGLVKNAGISIDTASLLDEVLSSGADYVQLPFNILDKRFTGKDFLKKAKAKSVKLFSRSVYLQGLLLMSEEKITGKLRDVIPVRRRLEAIAKEKGMSPAELYMRFVLSHDEIDSVLTGVDNVTQLKENIALFAKGPLDKETLERIDKIVPEFPEEIVRPNKWPKKI